MNGGCEYGKYSEINSQLFRLQNWIDHCIHLVIPNNMAQTELLERNYNSKKKKKCIIIITIVKIHSVQNKN